MERQTLMQNQMRERQMAMQIAWSREFLKYYSTFFSLAALGLTIWWAESIMVSEHDRLDLPHGVANFPSIEKARRAKSSLSSHFEK
ncbi:unnamed protein product, partial [Coregonus sp. 'balchen']